MYSFFRIAIFAAVSTLAATAHALPPATEPGEPFLYEAATHFIENPGCAQSGSPCTFDLYFGDNYKTTVTATRKQIEKLIFERYDAMMGEAVEAHESADNGNHEATSEHDSDATRDQPHGLAAESSTPSDSPGQMML